MPVVDSFIADLKDAVQEAKLAPSGQGSMVAIYGASSRSSNRRPAIVDSCVGLGKSSALGPEMVGELATAFLDTLYKA